MIRETALVLLSFLAAGAALAQQNVAATNSSARLEDNSQQTRSASERGSRKDAKLFVGPNFASPSQTTETQNLHSTESESSLITALVEWRDRKSTRLNSSHANISYAVFCLKKKRIK